MNNILSEIIVWYRRRRINVMILAKWRKTLIEWVKNVKLSRKKQFAVEFWMKVKLYGFPDFKEMVSSTKLILHYFQGHSDIFENCIIFKCSVFV